MSQELRDLPRQSSRALCGELTRRGRQRKRWEYNIRDWTGLELSDISVSILVIMATHSSRMTVIHLVAWHLGLSSSSVRSVTPCRMCLCWCSYQYNIWSGMWRSITHPVQNPWSLTIGHVAKFSHKCCDTGHHIKWDTSPRGPGGKIPSKFEGGTWHAVLRSAND